jgi:hypothetical protein
MYVRGVGLAEFVILVFGSSLGHEGVRMKFYEIDCFFGISLLLQRKLGKESSFKNPFCERGS